jgi:hypothetical protein
MTLPTSAGITIRDAMDRRVAPQSAPAQWVVEPGKAVVEPQPQAMAVEVGPAQIEAPRKPRLAMMSDIGSKVSIAPPAAAPMPSIAMPEARGSRGPQLGGSTGGNEAAAMVKANQQAAIDAQYGGVRSFSSDIRAKSPLGRAALSLEGSPYAYKPEFRPPEQAPGEVNVGPMAQNMAEDPVASTAVRKLPNGMLGIDVNKNVKLLDSITAEQEKRIGKLESRLAKMKR